MDCCDWVVAQKVEASVREPAVGGRPSGEGGVSEKLVVS